MLLDLFWNLRTLGKGPKPFRHVKTFHLYCKFTVWLHAICSALLGIKEYFGGPIDCVLGESMTLSTAIMNQYCWVTGAWTFTLGSATSNHKNRGIHPGVEARPARALDGSDKVYHRYYQWVPLVLLIIACAFYLPRYLWENLEVGRKVAEVSQRVMTRAGEQPDEDLAHVLLSRSSNGSGRNNLVLALQHLLCQASYLLVVAVVWVLTDLSLNGMFSSYGYDCLVSTFAALAVWEGDQGGFGGGLRSIIRTLVRPDGWNGRSVPPGDVAFPKMVKCTFSKYGYSGTPESIDSLCILPLNVINEKVFFVLWFWYLMLGLDSALTLTYQLFMVSCRSARGSRMRRHLDAKDRGQAHVVRFCRGLSYGDWFLLSELRRHSDGLALNRAIIKMASVQQDYLSCNGLYLHHTAKAVSAKQTGGLKVASNEKPLNFPNIMGRSSPAVVVIEVDGNKRGDPSVRKSMCKMLIERVMCRRRLA